MISKTQTFSHDSECGGTFTKWIERFEDAVATHGPRLSEEESARVLVMKLDTEVYNLFRDHIRPRTTKELKYEEVNTILETLFGDKDSIFRRRYDAFRVVLKDVNFRSYATMVKNLADLQLQRDVSSVTKRLTWQWVVRRRRCERRRLTTTRRRGTENSPKSILEA